MLVAAGRIVPCRSAAGWTTAPPLNRDAVQLDTPLSSNSSTSRDDKSGRTELISPRSDDLVLSRERGGDEMSSPSSEPSSVEDWLADTATTLDVARQVGWEDFVQQYEAVLRAATEQFPTISDRLTDLMRDAHKLQPHRFLHEYVDAMSVSIENDRVFLPSFSDQCLWQVVSGPDPSLGLSPLRGLYYAWRMSEIASTFQSHQPRSLVRAYNKLENLLNDRLAADFAAQGASADYIRYERTLRNDPPSAQWDAQIENTKRAIRTVAAPLKWRWIHLFPYPCVTSSHFYLSGVRFYHNAHIHHTVDQGPDDRYCVHSTDSGLAAPSERYGMLMPAGADPEIAMELLEEIPPGSLLLDLSADQATPDDRANLKFFENWSRLITARTHSIVSETLSMRSYGTKRNRAHRSSLYGRLGRAYYLEALTKNPMRTFYFDTGILGAARLAVRDGLPKVQYATTRRTKIQKKGRQGAAGRAMLEQLFGKYGDGIEFYVSDGAEWPSEGMAAWTLVPIGPNLTSRTSCLWSIRGADSRKISHGIEGLRRDAYLREAVSPSELAAESFEALAGGILGGAIVPGQIVTGVILGGLVGAGANVAKLRLTTNKVIADIENIPNSIRYHRVYDVAGFPS